MAVQKKNRRKVFVRLIASLAFVLLLAVGLFLWAGFNDKPPQFFPLNNAEGTYFVTKNCPQQGWQDSPSMRQQTYCVIYKGPGVLMDDQNKKTFTIVVGKSAVDLRAFDEKYVRNIKGEFVSSTQQCILDKCIAINGPHVALDIENLEIAAAPQEPLPEVFVGRTPCGALLRNINAIPESRCNRIKNRLMLNQNMFQYEIIYVGNDDTRYIKTGKWSVNEDIKPGQTVYQLDFDNSDQNMSFLKVDNNILLFLDSDMNVIVGTAGESYALNREQ